MSSEHDDTSARKQPLPQNSFTQVLEQLAKKTTLFRFDKAARKSANTSISICESTAKDDSDKLLFVVDTQDEADFNPLREQVEDILGNDVQYELIRKKSVTPEVFNARYKNVTLLDPENANNVQAFATQFENSSKKIKP